MVALAFGLKVLFVPLALAFGGGQGPEVPVEGLALFMLISFVFLPVETLAGQAFPIWLLGKLGLRNRLGLCLLSGLFFGLLHAPLGGAGFVAGLSGGIAFSYCWLSWRVLSFFKAFWWTTLVHAAHNAIAFLITLALLAVS